MFRERCPNCGASFGRRNPEHIYPPDLAQRPWYRLVPATLRCTACKTAVQARYAWWSWLVFLLWMAAFYAVRRLSRDWLPDHVSPGLASNLHDFSPILFVGFSGLLTQLGRRYRAAAPPDLSRSPAGDTPPRAR